jgi:N-methylhydantoinase A
MADTTEDTDALDPNDVALCTDVGGTFTDILVLDLKRRRIMASAKVPSTPQDPSDAAITGVDRLSQGAPWRAGAVFHGTTVGTNALIQGRAALTALVTTEGFRDVLALRRQARPRLYDLEAEVSPPLVPRERRLEVRERMAPDGTVVVTLETDEMARVVAEIEALDVEAVAICLLHAYANDEHERALGEAVSKALPDAFVSLSSDVCREFREFERTSTVTVNAYIGPPVRDYLARFREKLAARAIPRLSIVKSNGGLTSAANAEKYPVHLIESGPAAGVIAAAVLGAAEGMDDLIAFDMGGTTAKVGVVAGGQPRLSTEFHAGRFVDGRDVGGYPIKSPVIDLIEIGAGGGSIARLDGFGVLKVGPESAGADPGPACYGRGGEQPTITDAHVALGHISADGFGSEDLDILPGPARAAIKKHLAQPLGWIMERAAWGVLTLANANMAELVRLVTLRRGLDPRDFTLVAFGGAGALHATEIAREVAVPRVVVPPYPGLFSAIGTALGNVRHDLVQTLLKRVDKLEPAELQAAFSNLEERARKLLDEEDLAPGHGTPVLGRYADLRFEGQMFEITLALEGPEALTADALAAAFRKAYVSDYGYDLEEHAVELVNARLVAQVPIWDGGWPTSADDPSIGRGATKRRKRQVFRPDGQAFDIDVIPRYTLKAGERIDGPAIIEDFGATIRILDGQVAQVRASGTLVIEG